MRLPLRPLALTTAALVGAFALYHEALRGGFVFDDITLLVEHSCHRGLERLPAMFDLSAGNFCALRPLRFLTFALDHALWGQDPFGFHLTNILLHGLIAALGGGVLGRLTGRPRLGLIAGALFLAHPIATEAVAYISGRRDLMMALCALLGVDAWLRQRQEAKAWRWAWLFICAAGALLSHESAAALPALLLGLELLQPRAEGRRARGGALGGLCIGVGAFAAWSVSARSISEKTGLWGETLSAHVGTALHAQLHYVQQLIAPLNLQADYTRDGFPIAGGLLEAGPLLGLLGVLAAAIVGWRLRRRAPLISLGLWSYAALLAPSSQLIPHHELLAEHRLYLPSLIFCALVAGGVEAGIARWGRGGWALAAAALLLYGGLTRARVPDWLSEEALWTATLEVAPRVARAHANLGALRAEQGRLEEAFMHFSVAVEVRPDLCPAWYSRGQLWQMRGRQRAANADFLAAWACKPNRRWRIPIGRALLRGCQLEQASALLPSDHPAWARARAACRPERGP